MVARLHCRPSPILLGLSILVHYREAKFSSHVFNELVHLFSSRLRKLSGGGCSNSIELQNRIELEKYYEL